MPKQWVSLINSGGEKSVDDFRISHLKDLKVHFCILGTHHWDERKAKSSKCHIINISGNGLKVHRTIFLSQPIPPGMVNAYPAPIKSGLLQRHMGSPCVQHTPKCDRLRFPYCPSLARMTQFQWDSFMSFLK